MHSTLKPQDPFNFSRCTGVHARTLHVKDFIYMLKLDRFLPDAFRVDYHNNEKKNVMADLCNWTKV